MKKILTLCCLFSLVACAAREGDDNLGDDDVVNPNPNPEPEPEPTPEPDCVTDEDCTDDVACATGVCEAGACTYEPVCDDDEVCNDDLDVCEPKVESLPVDHRLRCFVNNGTLYVTVSGKLTDANYGGTLVDPVYVSLASDAIAGSWNATTPPTTYRIALTSQETALGGLVSGSIAVPEELARRFTLLIWPSSGTAQRFDLSSWDISGETCARISDGATSGGASDGHIVGRAPLCPSACDDGNASTTDVCTPTGCTHSGGSTPAAPVVSCVEGSTTTQVTISGGILAHLNTDVTPSAGWSVGFGYGGTSSVEWQSDSSSYLLTMPNSVTEFSFVLKNGSGIVQSWFDVDEFVTSGTCGKNAADTAFTHVPQSTNVGVIRCELMIVDGALKRQVKLIPDAGHDIREGLAESPSFLPSPSVIQYGGSDGWTLPYAAGSTKPQLSWVGGTTTYTFYLDSAVDDFNFFAVDNDDPSDSYAGGDFFLLDKWTITNAGSSACHRVGGGISIN